MLLKGSAMKKINLGWGLVLWFGLIVLIQIAQYAISSQKEPLSRVSVEHENQKGLKVFETCAACHELHVRQNKVGPYLYGVIGRRAGSVSDFSYSQAMKSAGFIWTRDKLRAFVLSPTTVVPGTAMGISGISEDEVDSLMEYLEFNK